MKTKHLIKFMSCIVICLTFGISNAQITSGTPLKSNQLSIKKNTPVLFAINLKTEKIDFIVKKETDLKAQLYKLKETYSNYDFLTGELKGDYKLISGMVKPYSGSTLSFLLDGNLTSKKSLPGDQFLPGDQYVINYDEKYIVNTTILAQEENEILLRVN